MSAPDVIKELVERFNLHRDAYMALNYNEAQLRRDFLDPFFAALGWDMENKLGYAEAYREVIHEESLKVEDSSRSPDYTFRIGVTRKFFVEAKKPSVDILSNVGAAFQIRVYGWSATLALSILTNFRDLCVYDCRVPPQVGDRASDHRVLKFSCSEYVDRWDEIYAIFARESILKGGFDRFTTEVAPRRGWIPPDELFLKTINKWRTDLAKNIAKNNDISQADLNYAVGQIIDRVIFLRICEDRGTEKFGTLLQVSKGAGIYGRLLKEFHKADSYYNSGLFYLKPQKGRVGKPDTLTPTLTINDYVLRDILVPLYEKNVYEFRFIPIEILGQVYEQFLGSVIQVEGHRAEVVEKPEIKKAGGVVYTPSYIVEYMVHETLGRLCEDKTPKEIAAIRVLDPACGSGTFLIGAYDFLLNWHLSWYVKNEGAKKGRIYETGAGWRLSEAERRRILLTNIFGVDIDAQAVEVTKLSLLLKLLEGASKDALELQFRAAHEPALPDLDANIRAGNSLVGADFYEMEGTAQLSVEQRQKVNAFEWEREFPKLMKSGGFDVVIGNPPYVLLQQELREPLQYEYFKQNYLAAYKIDLYHLFIQRVLELTKLGGYSSLITPSNYLTNNYMARLRRYMVEEGYLRNVSVIDGKVFKHRAVDTAIFIAENTDKMPPKFEVRRAKAIPSLPTISTTTLTASQVLSTPEVLFTGGNREAHNLWTRLGRTCDSLGSSVWVNFGKQLRDREKFTDDVIKVQSLADVPDGYLPCYTGDDVERYSVTWTGLASLTTRDAKAGGCWDDARQNQRNKLLTRQIGYWPDYAIDVLGYQCLNTIFMLNPKTDAVNPLCLLGILNSKLLRAFWLDRYYDRRHTFPKIKGTYLKKLPVPRLKGAAKQSLYEDLEAQIKTANELREKIRRASPADLDFLDRECESVDRGIDATVYRLYDLTSEEIGVVENILVQHSTLQAAVKTPTEGHQETLYGIVPKRVRRRGRRT